MRIYSIVRTGATSVKFVERVSERIVADSQFKQTASIKSNIPYSFDPMLLFLHLNSRDQIKELSVYDCDGHQWFHIESEIPLLSVGQAGLSTINMMR